MDKYVCACNYEYAPAEHDGVSFEELPEDWECPVCGATKDTFYKV